jgi:hypothetical protein
LAFPEEIIFKTICKKLVIVSLEKHTDNKKSGHQSIFPQRESKANVLLRSSAYEKR